MPPPISGRPGIRSSGRSSLARAGAGATPTRSSSTPPAGRSAAQSHIRCAERSHPRDGEAFDSCQLRVGTVGEVKPEQVARTRFLDPGESTPPEELVELAGTEQA